jgi:hypothetical protein
MKSKTTSAAAVLGAILGAVAFWGPAAAGPAQVPAPEHLMALAFPGWADSAGGRLQSVTLPRGSGTHAGWSADAARVLAEPRLVLRTDATHLTLVAGLLPAGEDGKPAVSQLTPMALAAYQFELRGAIWAMAARQGIFAWRGFDGAATLRAVALSSQHQGLGIEYGGCWDGYCGTWIALYELNRGMVRRQPVVELALSGNNVDGAADCARRLQPLLKARNPDAPAREDGAASDTHDCYAVESSWAVDPARDQPGDLVIHYQGAISRADAHAAAPVAIDQKQVLRYGSGKYRAVSGFNPVPPI